MSRAGRYPPTQRAQAALILAELESVRARLAVLERGSARREQPQLTGDNTPSSDTLDTIQEGMAKEEELLTRQALMERLKVLARAEEKIREGTYGICEACGRAIPTARLRAVPEAVRCVSCAEQDDQPTLPSAGRRMPRRG
ncbi:MAG: TraR/DksA C4-type zinc finger protein [candidate division NC10 bacterium]|nr:TraR/DksA C4-type zinc finger protein [candidate division NC10 bacterium]